MSRGICYLLLILTILVSPICAISANTKQTDMEKLGGALYRDTNLSLNQNQACMTCHHPSAGFADPDNRIDPYLSPVSAGSVPGLFGGRNAPTSAYAGYSPILHYDVNEELWIGGVFWDGRATGKILDDPLAEQAQGPFLNPVEMALPDGGSLGKGYYVVQKVLGSNYADLFLKACGPVDLANPRSVDDAYDCIGLAIGDFERTKFLLKFNSKFDKFWSEQGGDVSTFGVNEAGIYTGPPTGFKSKYFSDQEANGLALFNAVDKGNCAACHLTSNDPNAQTPLLTDFTYDNLGIPTNAWLYSLAGGFPPDLGLGGFLASTDGQKLFPGADAASQNGKFKVPTLRNVARSAPYGHNGYFPTLYLITHFYNTRDTLVGSPCTPANPVNWGVEGVTCWSEPEYISTMNTDELGNLGLTTDEELDIVAFMETLTD